MLKDGVIIYNAIYINNKKFDIKDGLNGCGCRVLKCLCGSVNSQIEECKDTTVIKCNDCNKEIAICKKKKSKLKSLEFFNPYYSSNGTAW